ncbi:MAG: hypothetical protein M1833_005368 [Piccolia ochrophora]|nr:MAG: hypothetical protein M1833_005368 [Piccolia ochrophora]
MEEGAEDEAAGRRSKRRRQMKIPSTIETANKLTPSDFIKKHLSSQCLKFSHPTKTNAYSIGLYNPTTLPPRTFDACFELLSFTSSADYAQSSIGWSPSKKRREMRLPDMRYLVAEPEGAEGSGEIVAFLAFMLTYEDGKEVVYCYEIHLKNEVRGCGLGRRLMQLMEEVGSAVGVGKAMLTVFITNQAAAKFYERLGYAVDEYSPGPITLRNGRVKEPSYVILSKRLP